MPEVEAWVMERLHSSIDPNAETQVDSYDSATVAFSHGGQPMIMFVAQPGHNGGGTVVRSTTIDEVAVDEVASPRGTRVWRFSCETSAFGERSVDLEPQSEADADELESVRELYKTLECETG